MTVTASLLPVFPECPTYGFSSTPDYLVKIVTREGGFETRDRKWEEPLHAYEGVPMGNRPQADIERILKFYHAVGATAYKFRFKDWIDYMSCDLDDEPSALDQPLTLVSGSPGGYQLLKRYATEDVAGYETYRTIRKPLGTSIRIANQAGVEQSSSTFNVEEDTGLINVLPGFSGTPATWGGEFYVPCRFAAPIKPTIVNRKIISLECYISEIRERL